MFWISATKNQAQRGKVDEMGNRQPIENSSGIPEEGPSACYSVEDTVQMKTSVGDGQRSSSVGVDDSIINRYELGMSGFDPGSSLFFFFLLFLPTSSHVSR